MSVPSLNTTVTTETPNFEIDRICSTLGSPLMAPSTGNESSDSTSSGDSAGASVITCTCTFVRSGTASIGRWSAEYTPSAAIRSVPTITRKRFRSDDSMMAFSMDEVSTREPELSIVLGLVLEDELTLEDEGAAGDHRLARVQARGDDLAVADLPADPDRMEGVAVALVAAGTAPLLVGGEEDPRLALDLDGGRGRDGQHLLGGRAVEGDPD